MPHALLLGLALAAQPLALNSSPTPQLATRAASESPPASAPAAVPLRQSVTIVPPLPLASGQWEYTLFETYGINPGATQEFLGLRSENTAKYLNTLGAQGWELVTVVREKDGERVYFVFKRPIPPAQ